MAYSEYVKQRILFYRRSRKNCMECLLIRKQEVCLEGKTAVLLQKCCTAVSRAHSKAVVVAVIASVVCQYLLAI